MGKFKNSLLLLFVSALSLWGCGKHEIRCDSPEDNPAHHYLVGMGLVEENRLEDAAAKFERALYCEKDYGPAHGGLAIVTALKAKGLKPEYRKIETGKAFDHLKSAYSDSSVPEYEFAYRVAAIRTYTALKQKGWLEEAEDDYKEAMKLKVDERKLVYYDGREAATYFIGLAYLEGREFQMARDRFSDVLGARKEGKWNEPADLAWRKADKIVRAMAGITLGDVGKEIAVMDAVKRADMAALLVDELKINKLFAGRIPVKSEIDKIKPEFIPVDIANSPFREETLSMMKWGIRGLVPTFDAGSNAYLFRPNEQVSRKEFALTLEDVIMKLTGDAKIASAFFGHEKSPFPDVPPTSAWYNAIMSVTTRNIMETELSGEFRPEESVDGAEAILAIRVLKQRLNIY